jgi:hypothetical protein
MEGNGKHSGPSEWQLVAVTMTGDSQRSARRRAQFKLDPKRHAQNKEEERRRYHAKTAAQGPRASTAGQYRKCPNCDSKWTIANFARSSDCRNFVQKKGTAIERKYLQ